MATEFDLFLNEILLSETSQYNSLLESFIQTPRGIAAIKKAILVGAISLSAFLASPLASKLDKRITEEIVEQVMENIDKRYDYDGDVIDFSKIPDFAEKLEAVTKIIAASINIEGSLYNINKLPVDPAMIVWYCFKYNFDIPLLCAQAHCENHFGADPKAKRCQKTKSLFSVGLYDDGRNLFNYDKFEDSIPHYIRLMKNDYLINGKKTINQLLQNNSLVNMDNKRYAFDRNYESKVRATRNKYMKLYPILKTNL